MLSFFIIVFSFFFVLFLLGVGKDSLGIQLNFHLLVCSIVVHIKWQGFLLPDGG
jgi:hypothetical protein